MVVEAPVVPISWLSLAPGVLLTPANRGEPGQFSNFGARPNTNTFTVDGVSGNNAVAGAGWPSLLPGGRLPAMTALGTTHNLASTDAIQEVTVASQGEALAAGQAPGANIIVHTRPGTNHTHASFFSSARPAALGANDWFANRYSLQHDAPSLDEEGGTWGAPLRRDRTFIFVAAERLAVKQGYAWTTTVPSVLARTLSPASLLALLNEFPLPNGPELTWGISELYGERRLPAEFSTVSARLDHQLSQKERLFLRFSNTPSWSESGFTQTDLTQYRNLTAVLGSTLSTARWLHEGRLSFSRNEATSTWSLSGDAEMPSPAFYAQNPSLAADSSNIEVGGAGSVSVGSDGRNVQNQWEASHGSAFETVRHQLHFGFNYIEQQCVRDSAGSAVTVAFGTPTDLIYGPLAPVWATYSRAEADSIRLRRFSAYAQDTWRISARLNLGFALHALWPQAPVVNPASNLYSVDGSTDAVESPISSVQPLWRMNPIQFAPAASAAYRLTARGSTVLRASWALMREAQSAAATDQLNGIPYKELQTPGGGPTDIDNPSNLAPVQLGYGFSRTLQLPTYERWNAGIQSQLSRHDSVEIFYSGLAGNHELRREITLNPSPSLGALIFSTSNGASQYNGLTTVYRRAIAAGAQANVSYSWSHSIDLNSSDSAVFLVSPVRRPSEDRGSSDFDVRHALHAAVTYSTAARAHGEILGRLVSDWTFGGMLTVRSGFPVNVQVSETLNGFATENFLPGVAPGVPLWVADTNCPGGRILNPDAFLYAVDGIPAIGRNVLRGFGMWQADMTMERPLWKKDGFHISFRVDAYNVFNHAQFADPVRYASNPMFGQSQSALNVMFGGGSPSSGQSPAFLMGAPRSLEASLRFGF